MSHWKGAKDDRGDRDKNAKEQAMLNKKTTNQMVAYLAKRTHFDEDQVKALCEIYKKICKRSKYGHMDRTKFRETLHLSLGIIDDVMLDRIFYAFDGDNSGYVAESEWVIGLSVMLRGTLDEQIRYCYEVYDVNMDRSLGMEELRTCLRGSLFYIPGVQIDIEEGERDLVDLAMDKFDLDQDGVLNFSDFRNAVRLDPLLLQAIGECLPTQKNMMTFLSLIESDPRSFTYHLSRPGDPGWRKNPTVLDLTKSSSDTDEQNSGNGIGLDGLRKSKANHGELVSIFQQAQILKQQEQKFNTKKKIRRR